MSLDTARTESRPERLGPDEIRSRLQHERDSRHAQLEAIADAGKHPGDDVLTAQKTSIQRVLKEIDAAFGRLEKGGYGDCGRCGRPIPVERLEILPYTAACVGCQRLVA